MDIPFRRGQFAWCMFPYMEEPLRPGPTPHIGYILSAGKLPGKPHITVASLYTTSRPWTPGTPLPKGIIPVEQDVARRMNQKGFVLDCRRIAFMPANLEFFPALSRADKGIVYQASRDFQKSLGTYVVKLMQQPGLVITLGPDAPQR